ncbi:MAG: asparagine synthase (glutamine-hydrolyzing) [Polyangiales bacterium]
MCGIAGIFAHHADAPRVALEELRAIRDAMARRGPDGFGEWLTQDGRVAFGHRRLSIIDLSDRAAQPMKSADGKLTVTFNGEIYNYAELRERLQAEGRVFRTTSDTEVLLHLYAARGPEMVRELRGMFAFAIWDEAKAGVFLARDPYGIKPLYYADDGRTLRFASQVRALLAGGAISRTPDAAGQVGFFLWGSVPEPFTSYEAIRALPAGSTLWVDGQGARDPKPYFSVGKTWADAFSRKIEPLGPGQLQSQVAEALRDSVKHHLVADVPVSAFLSAGIDSGTLVALMTELGAQGCHAITLAFTEFEGSINDELPLAREVAREYGVQHHVRYVDEQEFARDLPAILAAMDQPSIDGVNTWFVSKATSELGLKVAVSGLGGDELFGGYGTFDEVPRFVRGAAWAKPYPMLGRALRKLSAPLLGALPMVHPKTAGLLEYGGSITGAYLLKRGLFMPWELPSVLPRDVVERGLARLAPLDRLAETLAPHTEAPFAQVATLEACQYMRNQLLRDTDWSSMAHSLEVRVPLVDHALLKRLAPLLASGRRFDAKAVLAQSPRHPLPRAVRAHQKTGFSTPAAKWMLKLPELDAWRRLRMLSSPSTPWARRLAYALGTTAFA